MTGHPVLDRAERELHEYFAGRRRSFTVPTRAVGTEFQRAVWTALRELPFATVCSYGALAARLGRPSAARAVGAANARNPLAIVVPCHRVVGSGAGLVGYAGGLPAKAWLLAHERHAAAALAG